MLKFTLKRKTNMHNTKLPTDLQISLQNDCKEVFLPNFFDFATKLSPGNYREICSCQVIITKFSCKSPLLCGKGKPTHHVIE